MSYQTEKTERAVKIFSIILGIVIFFTMLSFFGIIDVRGKYCDISSGFACTNLKVTSNAVKFTLENNIAEMNEITLRLVDHSGCSEFKKEKVKGGEFINVEISCTITEPQGNKFKDKVEINYKTSTSLEDRSGAGRIKTTVTAS